MALAPSQVEMTLPGMGGGTVAAGNAGQLIITDPDAPPPRKFIMIYIIVDPDAPPPRKFSIVDEGAPPPRKIT
jgi:hypothetical protein